MPASVRPEARGPQTNPHQGCRSGTKGGPAPLPLPLHSGSKTAPARPLPALSPLVISTNNPICRSNYGPQEGRDSCQKM